MDPGFPLHILETTGGTCQYVLIDFFMGEKSLAKAHMSLGTHSDAAVSAPLVAVVSLVSILQAGDWSRVSSLARHHFSVHLATTE